jgi:hypothetical protein
MNSTKQHWRRIAQPTVDPTTGQLPRHQDPRHLPKLVGGNTGMVRHRRRLPGLSRHAGLQLNPATDWMYTADPGKAGPGFAVDSPLGASLYCALARACASRWRNSAIPSSPGPAAGRKYALRALFWALKVSFEAAEQRFRGVRGRRRPCANQRLDGRKANCGTERGSEKGCFVCGTDGSNPSPSPRFALRPRRKLRCRPGNRRSRNHRVRPPAGGCCEVCYLGLHRRIHFGCRRVAQRTAGNNPLGLYRSVWGHARAGQGC